MDWIGNTQWLLWVAVAILAGLVEVMTLDLIFLMVAGGAFAAAVAAALGVPFALQVLLFAVATALLLVAARPPLLRYARDNVPSVATNAAALVGRDAVVLVEVTPSAGRVRLGGEVWSARAVHKGLVLEVGSTVHVVRIDGATAVVSPLNPRAELPAAAPTEGPLGDQ